MIEPMFVMQPPASPSQERSLSPRRSACMPLAPVCAVFESPPYEPTTLERSAAPLSLLPSEIERASRDAHSSSSELGPPSDLRIRSYNAQDRAAVTEFLDVLPVLYPGGSDWLEGRLDEVRPRGPRCTLALRSGRLAGV